MSADIYLPKDTHPIKITVLMCWQRTLLISHQLEVCLISVTEMTWCVTAEKVMDGHEKSSPFWNTSHLLLVYGVLSGTTEHVLCRHVCTALPNIFLFSLYCKALSGRLSPAKKVHDGRPVNVCESLHHKSLNFRGEKEDEALSHEWHVNYSSLPHPPILYVATRHKHPNKQLSLPSWIQA